MRRFVLAATAMTVLLGSTALAMAQSGAPPPRGGEPQVGPGNTVTPSPSGTQAIPERVEPGPGASTPGAGLQGTPGVQNQNELAQRSGQQGESEKPGVNGGQQQTDQERSGDGGSNKLSQDQRSKIKQMAAKDRGAHVDRVNFSVKVGAVLPKTIHITVVPEDIVAVVPEYRGFDYVVVGDDVLIVNPDTLRIVAVIPA